MTIAVTSLGTAIDTASSTCLLSGLTVPAGSFIFVTVRESVATASGTISDSAGNTWITIPGAASGGAAGFATNFYTYNSLALTAGSITYTKNASINGTVLSALYATGIQTSANPIDNSVTAGPTTSAAGANPPSITSGIPSISGDLLIGVTASADPTTLLTYTIDTTHGWAVPPAFVASTTALGAAGGGSQVNTGRAATIFAPTFGTPANSGGTVGWVFGFLAQPSIKSSKINTYNVLAQADIRVSKINTYNVLAQADIRVSKINTYNVLAVAPPSIPFGERTTWLAMLQAQQVADEDIVAGIRSLALRNRTIPLIGPISLVLADRVMETTNTIGTGTVICTGPVTQYQPFTVIGANNTTWYAIISGDGVNWETGIGTIAQLNPSGIARTTVLSSSNGGAPISLAGVSTIFCDLPAAKANSAAPLGSTFLPVTIARPAGSTFSWVNQGTSSYVDNSNGPLTLVPQPASNVIRALVKATPSAPWTMTVRLNLSLSEMTQYSSSGLCVYDGTGKEIVLCYGYQTAINQIIVASNVALLTDPRIPPSGDCWLRIYNNGTNFLFQTSPNGAVWQTIYTYGVGAYLGTIVSAGFYANPGTSTLAYSIDMLGFELVSGAGTNTTWIAHT